jgi:hypothetical protein
MTKFNQWLKGIFCEPNDSESVFADGLTEDQKKHIVNSALTAAGQILMSAVVLTNSQNFITGDCIYPDGSRWTIKFEKKK